MLPDKLPLLDVSIGALRQAGQLIKGSTYEFRYLDPSPDQPAVSLLMPPGAKLTWQSGDLFPSMDQNLPEGDLFMRIRQLFPKQPTTPMHLLALIGENGIGRLGFTMPGAAPSPRAQTLNRETLLRLRYTPELFDELVRAYLNTGAGIAGMQPKIMVPDRPTIPIPSLIVKAASPAYPGLAANEFLCLSAAKRAGIEVPGFDLSDDGQLLLVDRFDVVAHPGGMLSAWASRTWPPCRASESGTSCRTASTTGAISASANCCNSSAFRHRSCIASSSRWPSRSWCEMATHISRTSASCIGPRGRLARAHVRCRHHGGVSLHPICGWT